MPSRTFDTERHSFVVVNPPGDLQRLWADGLWPMVHYATRGKEAFVWVLVPVELWETAPVEDAVLLDDGRSTHDRLTGSCVVSVPAEWCAFCTLEEVSAMTDFQRGRHIPAIGDRH